MTKNESLIAHAYSAFNQRNINEALALMSDSVLGVAQCLAPPNKR